MTWKELKHKLGSLSKEELDLPAVFISDCRTQSGIIQTAKKLPAALYNTHEDDLNELRTKKELLAEGIEKEELEDCTIEFKKGEFYIEVALNG